MAKYSLEAKLKAVNDVRKRGISSGSVAKSLHTAKAVVQRWVVLYGDFGIPSDATVGKWERIYWEEVPQALYKGNRGRKNKIMKDKINKPKMDEQVEEDLIAEVQRLRMENEYLKKLNALVQAKEKLEKNTK